VGLENHVLDEGPNPPWKATILKGKGASHCIGTLGGVCAKMVEPIEMRFGFTIRIGAGNHALDGGPDTHRKGQCLGKEEPIVSIGTFCRELWKSGRTAEQIDLPFGLWTRVGRRKHKFNRIRQVASVCSHGKAHWRHLANTIEAPVCCGVLCQITLTTCYYFVPHRGAVSLYVRSLA